MDTCRAKGSTYFTIKRNGKDLEFRAPRCKIHVAFQKAFVSIRVPENPYFGDEVLEGVCGDCTGEKDDMILRNGQEPKGETTEANMAMIGQSYAVRGSDVNEKK